MILARQAGPGGAGGSNRSAPLWVSCGDESRGQAWVTVVSGGAVPGVVWRCGATWVVGRGTHDRAAPAVPGGWGQGLRHRAPAPRVLPEGLWGARAGFQVHDVLLEMGQVQEDAFPVLE